MAVQLVRSLGLLALPLGLLFLSARAGLAQTTASTPSTPVPADACPDQRETLARVEKRLAEQPHDAMAHYFEAVIRARCGDASRAAAALRETARYGDGFLPVHDLFVKVWDAPEFQAEYSAMLRELPRVTDAQEVFRIHHRDLIPEGIAWDAKRARLLIGSIARGEIYATAADGSSVLFATVPRDVAGVLGIAIDGTRRRVYAVATSVLGGDEEGKSARNAVIELDADSGKQLRRIDAAAAGQLNDVAVSKNGTIYASDIGSGTVWQAAPGANELSRMLDENTLRGANGLALAEGEKSLYVADTLGIARVDLATRKVERLENRTRETLGAIDGLYRRGDLLIGVQNATNPGRVIAMRLDKSGSVVESVKTLLSHHHPALNEPTTGAVDGDRFLLLANSFAGRFGDDGTIRDPESVTEPVILALPLGSGSEVQHRSGKAGE